MHSKIWKLFLAVTCRVGVLIIFVTVGLAQPSAFSTSGAQGLQLIRQGLFASPKLLVGADDHCPDCVTVGDLMWISDMSFADRSHGWLTGQVYDKSSSCQQYGWQCQLVVLRTQDGGVHWKPITSPVRTAGWTDGSGQHGVNQVFFVNDRDGWIYGQGLWSTQDGGETWHHDGTGMYVDQLVVRNHAIWALDSSCGPESTCSMFIRTATVGSRSWHQVSPSWPTKLWVARTQMVVTPRRVFIVASSIATGHMGHPVVKAVLFQRQLTGGRWETRSTPCGSSYAPLDDGFIADIAADGSQVALLCGGLPMSGLTSQPLQQKALYRTQDNGRRWQLVAFTDGYQVDCKHIRAPSSARCTLPGKGTVVRGSLTVFNAGRMWLSCALGALSASGNGGQTWAASLPYPQTGAAEHGIATAQFANPSDGWTFGTSTRIIYRTVDGGARWTSIIVPRRN